MSEHFIGCLRRPRLGPESCPCRAHTSSPSSPGTTGSGRSGRSRVTPSLAALASQGGVAGAPAGTGHPARAPIPQRPGGLWTEAYRPSRAGGRCRMHLSRTWASFPACSVPQKTESIILAGASQADRSTGRHLPPGQDGILAPRAPQGLHGDSPRRQVALVAEGWQQVSLAPSSEAQPLEA